MDCRGMEQLISPYLDGELTPAEAAELSLHLLVCDTCHGEYAAMVRISAACQQRLDIILPAPAGFKDALMLHIGKIEKAATPIGYSSWFNRGWKQAAGAAAAILLLLGAASINTTPLVQLASKIPALIQPDSLSSIAVNTVTQAPSDPAEIATSIPQNVVPAPQTVDPALPTNNSSTPQIASVPSAGVSHPAPVFLNKERFITTTLLQVKVPDATAALEQATNLAATAQATTQNLGQQVNATTSYTVLKITVGKSAASSLLADLGNLGRVSGQQIDRKDISTDYADTLSQYQTLITQRATLQDASQGPELDQRIDILISELQDWEQKAEQETIVLWLEK